MTPERSFQRAAAIAAILSTPLAFGNTVTMLLAAEWSLDVILDPLQLLAAGEAAASMWRWSMILDMLGYYLLIIPLILVLRRWLGTSRPAWAELFSLALLSYSLIGATGAALHAAILPPLMHAYVSADAGQQGVTRELFLAAHNAVMYGLWNLLDALVSGVGWLGFGALLLRERRALGVATLVLGAASLLDGLGVILQAEALATAGLLVYLLLAPVWAGWIGLDLLRRPLASSLPVEIADSAASRAAPASAGL